MTSTTETIEQPVEHADLARFGYNQELHRRVGSFASFAAGFSYVSILTTVFQLFFLGFGFGGAAFFWTWPIVFIGQMLVALNFATLAARFPISGAIFQWSSRLAGQTFGWFTGWVMIIGQILTVAAAAIALQAVLPSIWSGFQFLGGDSSPTSVSGARNAVLLGVILLAVTTAVNIIGIRLMAIISSTGVVLEILGVIAIVITLFAHAKRGPSVVMHSTGAAPTPGDPYIWAFLASGLMAAYVMVGFDSAGELSEETHAPRRITPRTIIRALIVSGVGGALLLIAALMAAPSLTDGNLASVGLPYVVEAVFGATAGRIILADVVIAIIVCTLACQTSGARMMYSMARQKALPFHGVLARVSPRTGTPIVTSLVVGVGAALVLVVNLGQSAVFTALSSLCIAMLYLGYLGVTAPLLLHRFRHARGRASAATAEGTDEHGKRLFSLGKWAIPVTVVAVIYQVLAVVNLAWPRSSVYDLTGHTWWLKWSAVLFIGITLVVGYLVHLRLRGGKVHIPHAWAHQPAAEPTPRARPRSRNRKAPEPRPGTERSTQPVMATAASEHETDTVALARADARAQGGRVADAMPYLPASSTPYPPPGVSLDSLTWAETVAGGNYTHKVVAGGTRVRLEDVAGQACAHVLLYNALEPWERLNVADTVKIGWQAYLTTGHPLLSGDGRVLATIVGDDSGRHDALCGTSTAAANRAKYGDSAPQGPVRPAGSCWCWRRPSTGWPRATCRRRSRSSRASASARTAAWNSPAAPARAGRSSCWPSFR